MSWFDDPKNTTGALTTRLANDAAQVKGVCVSFGLLFVLIGCFVSWPEINFLITGVLIIIKRLNKYLAQFVCPIAKILTIETLYTVQCIHNL